MSAVITDRVREILATAEVDGLHVRLTVQLDRNEYVQVNKILEALGGKWNRRERAHVFTADPSAALAEFLDGGAAPKPARTAEGYVATPPEIADRIVALADLAPGVAVLEPSAGDGALVSAIRRVGLDPMPVVVAVEPNADRSSALIALAKVIVVDTLENFAASEPAPFDAVVMNPPFAMPGQPTAWIDHVQLAWRLLAPGGRLVSVVPAGFAHRQDRRHVAMRDLIAEHGGCDDLPIDAFEVSGTGVRTMAIWADKPGGAS